MARNNERDWILAQRLTHGARRSGLPKRAGQFAVCRSPTRRDFSRCFVDARRKLADGTELDDDIVKILSRPFQMLAHSPDDLANLLRRRARIPRAAFPGDSSLGLRGVSLGKLKRGH